LSTAPDSSRRSGHADKLFDQRRWLEAELGAQELAKPAVLAQSLGRVALGQVHRDHRAMGTLAKRFVT